MRILSILIRIYFLIAGVVGFKNIVIVFNRDVAWSYWVLVSVLVTSLLSIAYIIFAWKFDEILLRKRLLIQIVLFASLCNTLTTVYFGSAGLNQATFSQLSINQLIMSSAVAVLFYIGLIIIIEKLSKNKQEEILRAPANP